MRGKILESGIEYLNVDLEVRSRVDLTPLVDALSGSLSVLYAGRIPRTFLATFEIGGLSPTPDAAVKRFAKALAAMPPAARKLWKGAQDRVFDIGLEKTANRGTFALALRPETVKTIAKLNARVAITVYPIEEQPRRRMPRRTARSS